MSSSAPWYSALVAPQRVAVVGASSDPAKGALLRNLLRLGFNGAVVPVNPRGGTIEGQAVVRSMSAAGDVDLALIVVPAQAVPDAVRDCAESGVRVAYVMSSGFAELGEAGLALEQAALAEAAKTGMRLVGPNTNGMISARAGLAASIMTTVADFDVPLRDSELALVSQSGAIGAFVLAGCLSAGLDVGTYFSTGNESDVGLEELISELVEDPGVRVILTYVEGLRDGPAFVAAAERARVLGKVIVMLKVGCTEEGARASASHTAAMAGADAVYDGVLRQLGVRRARDLRQLVGAAQILLLAHRPLGRRLGVVSISGGLAVMATDAAVTRGLDLPQWAASSHQVLSGLLPSYLETRNPLDTSGVMADDPQLLISILDAAAHDTATDVVVLCLGGSRARESVISDVLIGGGTQFTKPIVVVWIGGGARVTPGLAAAGIPCFDSVEDAIIAVDLSTAALTPPSQAPRSVRSGDDPVLLVAREVITAAKQRGAGALDELEGKQILKAFGIPCAVERVVATPEEVSAAVGGLSFPLVAKLRSAELLHKSDAGGVILGITNLADVQDAVARLFELADTLELRGADVLLQEQADVGTELILGASTDPTFGPVVTLGVGGVSAEVSPDVGVRLTSLGTADVTALLGSLRSQTLLDGFRGAAAVDRDELASVTTRFAEMVDALAPWVTEIDINPLAVGRTDAVLVALDALMVLR